MTAVFLCPLLYWPAISFYKRIKASNRRSAWMPCKMGCGVKRHMMVELGRGQRTKEDRLSPDHRRGGRRDITPGTLENHVFVLIFKHAEFQTIIHVAAQPAAPLPCAQLPSAQLRVSCEAGVLYECAMHERRGHRGSHGPHPESTHTQLVSAVDAALQTRLGVRRCGSAGVRYRTPEQTYLPRCHIP